MANSTGGLFHTMLAATTEAAAHPSFRNAFLDRIPNAVDVTKADELARGWREAAPGLFKQPAETAEAAPRGATGQALDLGHLAGRGGRDTGVKSVTYTRAEVAQAGWQQKRPELVEALKAGTATLSEG